jgi:tetratricopeptide (TPR) repeat protein
MKNLTLIVLAAFFLTFPAAAQTDVEPIVKRAQNLGSREKPEAAIAEINKAIAIEPQNPDLYLRRAEFYFISQNKPEILKDARKATALAPTDKQVLYRAALVLFRSQQYQEALKISDELMALGDVDHSGWSVRIQIKTHLEDFFGAFEDASTAVELFPENIYFKQNQANLVRLMGDSDKALEMFDALVAASEKKLAAAKNDNEKITAKRALSMFLFSRAHLNFKQLSKELGLADLIKAVDYLPEGPSYFQRGRMYRELKMFPEALADFTTIIEGKLKFDKWAVYIDRGDVYYSMQKYAEAVADYETAAKNNESVREFMEKRISLAKQKMAELNQMK